MFQSTRPQEARQFIDVEFPKLLVSIHAPTRGATVVSWFYLWCVRFNPRAHERRDRISSLRSMTKRVSIHAPTRGATLTVGRQKDSKMFQSTRPREARLAVFWIPVVLLCFNPRAHERRDGNTAAYTQHVEFQSTRPREARPPWAESYPRLSVSIHAPTRGATTEQSPSGEAKSFNPRAHERRDFIVK